MVIERYPEGGWRGRGSNTFRESPRKGEVITLDDENGQGQAFEVIAVIHPLEPASTAGDLIVRHLGNQTDWRNSL